MKSFRAAAVAVALTLAFGAANIGAASACDDGPTQEDAYGSSPTPLDVSKLAFGKRSWHGADLDAGTFSAKVPRGWTFAQLSDQQAQFSDPTRTWRVRVNGEPLGPESPAEHLRQRVADLQGVPGLRVLNRTRGATRGLVFGTNTFRTLTYSYLNPGDARRLVKVRWVVPEGEGGGTWWEIAAGGRPMDRAGLRQLLRQATRTVFTCC